MMVTTRQEAIRTISSDNTLMEAFAEQAATQLPNDFGSLVFNDQVQRQRLPGPLYQALRETIEAGAQLKPDVADAVASAMKDWAIEHGATHYTHWFQPMTGSTAEKHDSFLCPTPDGRAILDFSGKQLSQGEPDASSFPSGGLRATFEARGYTGWDPTSPAFIRKSSNGSTLTIPTVFCSWTGDALDKKTPLLRSMEAVSKSAVRLVNMLSDEKISRVTPSAGVEQEYFLVDRQFYVLRPDLLTCGRTLFGAPPYKGQEFDDHYFGTINQRVLRFMMELEHELWHLGVPIQTRHNEVAPTQFELAPHYSLVSVACDQNLLTMDVLREVAARHGLQALLHEKPYAGLNGSGKHLNWSLADDRGHNLFNPGDTPEKNAMFMMFLSAIVRGVDLHQDLLRASIASAGNDHRLGANEAPPAIISIFVGSQLEEVVDALIEGRPVSSADESPLELGVSSLPELPRDISDRNRTSAFAFTGNKFEFRAVASSQSVAYPASFLNLIMAESLDYIADRIESRGGATVDNVQAVVRDVLEKHRRILFAGDNYTEEWTREAERRGLLNRRATPEAVAELASSDNVALFERYGVLTRNEAESRLNVLNEKYAATIKIEARATYDIARTMLLPAGYAFQKQQADTLNAVKSADGTLDLAAQEESLRQTTAAIGRLSRALEALGEIHCQVEDGALDEGESASAYHDKVLPAMNSVREEADRLECLVDDDLWPLPKFREMLFIQ